MNNLDKESIRLMVVEELRKRQFGETFWDKIEKIAFRVILLSALVLFLFLILALIIKAIYSI